MLKYFIMDHPKVMNAQSRCKLRLFGFLVFTFEFLSSSGNLIFRIFRLAWHLQNGRMRFPLPLYTISKFSLSAFRKKVQGCLVLEGLTFVNVSMIKCYDFYLFKYICWSRACNAFSCTKQNYVLLKWNVLNQNYHFLAYQNISKIYRIHPVCPFVLRDKHQNFFL